MAKGMHYFKFIPTEWLTGDIVYESFELQGLFINICALYWQRDGKVTLEDIEKRFKSELIPKLSGRFFSVNDSFISIKFLDEQLVAANHTSKTNSNNGKKGGRPKSQAGVSGKATAKRLESEIKRLESEPKAKKSQLKEIKLELELKEIKEKEREEEIIVLLPQNETEPNHVDAEKAYTGFQVTAEEKKDIPPPPRSAYAECMEAYNNFIIENTGVPAKIDGQQGKAMKSIIEYLRKAANDKSDDGVVGSFKFILEYKSKWDPFHQKQLTLSQINSNLINIISSIKNPTQHAKTSIYDTSKYR